MTFPWKDWRHVLAVAGAAGALSMSGWNVFTLWQTFEWRFGGGFGNLAAGRPFTTTYHRASARIRVPLAAIPAGSRVFFWDEPRPEYAVATECRAITLNYYLYPSRVGYLDDRDLYGSDYAVVDDTSEALFHERVKALSKGMGLPLAFEPVLDAESIIVLRRRR
jgi:hypothetical protein